MEHGGTPVANRSCLMSPSGWTRKSPDCPLVLVATGSFCWKKKCNGCFLKKLLFSGKKVLLPSNRKGVSNGGRKCWPVSSQSHLVAFRCKHGSWSHLHVFLLGQMASPQLRKGTCLHNSVPDGCPLWCFLTVAFKGPQDLPQASRPPLSISSSSPTGPPALPRAFALPSLCSENPSSACS